MGSSENEGIHEAITDKADFHTKVRASMRQLQNDPEKIRSFYQKPSLKYAA
jgi:hypothetical protein